MTGVLRAGTPCWSVLANDGSRVHVVGDLSGVRDGDTVYACGVPATAEFCGEGQALTVSWISTALAGGTALPATVVRDVAVTVTLSSADLSPLFDLEGREPGLDGSSGTWRGVFPQVTVRHQLDVLFRIRAWHGQEFVLSVAATDPASGKTWKHSLSGTASKGRVIIQGALDVGAAPAPAGEPPVAVG